MMNVNTNECVYLGGYIFKHMGKNEEADYNASQRPSASQESPERRGW